MKTAIVHDYLIDFGGAERVLLALHEMYPKAPIYVSILDKRGLGDHWEKFKSAEIKTSWFDYLPFSAKLISPLRFLLPLIWKSFNLSKYDLIIDSSSWAITRGFKSRAGQTEICYCHTPPRYLYGYDTSRRYQNKWYGSIVSFYALIVNHFMRIYDFQSAQKVDQFVVNSKNVAERVKKFYGRESTVIYPPVETSKSTTSFTGDYYLTGGRLVAAKNFNLIIKACKGLGVKLKIFGKGPMERELKTISNENIEFLGKVSDSELPNIYESAKAFIVAQTDEDFGMTTVEAMAQGCPVIAYRGGGYLESVVEGQTGIFFDKLRVDELVKAINKFEKSKIRKEDCTKQASKFSVDKFKNKMKDFVQKYARTS